jgi:hypothetical protein
MIKKILIIGNDHNMNDINFAKLKRNTKLVTIGLNRIWHKYIPDYLFFSDIIILHELMKHPDIFEKCNLVTSNRIYRKKNSHVLIDKLVADGKLQVFAKGIRVNSNYSAINAIGIAKVHLFPNDNCKFYLAAMSLRYNPKLNHFWEKKRSVVRTLKPHQLTAKWYIPRLNEQFLILRNLKGIYNIISVTPNSQLNGPYNYKNIKQLYKKQ